MVYKPEIYDYDDVDAPALENPSSFIPDVLLPVVTGVNMQSTGDGLFKVLWNTAVGAQSYTLQISGDDLDLFDPLKDWETVIQTTSTFFELAFLTEYAYVRVAAINAGQGPWAYYEQSVTFETLITEPTLAADGITLTTEDGIEFTTESNF